MTALLRDQGYRIGKIKGDGAVREVPSIEHDLEFGDTDTFDFVFVPPDQGWVFETLA